jgi:hypothetical protein
MKSALLLAAALALVACTPGGGVDTWTYEISMSVLPDLTEGRYVAWLIDADGETTLLMEYTEGSGDSVDVSFNPADFDEVIISINASDGTLTAPSAAVMFRLDLEEWGGSFLSQVPFATLSGTVTLWSPTDGTPDDPTAGAWFVDVSGAEPAPSLLIPVLPDGFRWESWVRTQDTTLTMGRFANADGADDGCPFCEVAAAAPMVPGEDFLTNLPAGFEAVDLADGDSRVWVTLEPDLDGVDPQGDTPFFTVLEDDISDQTEPSVPFELFGPDMPGILGSLNILTEGYEG